jgi:hypothetical protein
MALPFPIESYLYEGIDEFFGLHPKDKADIMTAACPLIERKLADMRYLKGFNRNGVQLFYNDRSGSQEEDSPYGEDHLKDSFNVNFDGTSFLISNPKTVKGGFNLFEDLLMAPSGSQEYRVPRTGRGLARARMGEERYAYETRTKKQNRRLERSLITGNLMTFYYRFDGKMCWKRDKRRGYYPEVITKFRSYIDGAIRYGVEIATPKQIGEDDYEAARGLISDQ